MYCQNCGSEASSEAKFCAVCGEKISNRNIDDTRTNEDTMEPKYSQGAINSWEKSVSNVGISACVLGYLVMFSASYYVFVYFPLYNPIFVLCSALLFIIFGFVSVMLGRAIANINAPNTDLFLWVIFIIYFFAIVGIITSIKVIENKIAMFVWSNSVKIILAIAGILSLAMIIESIYGLFCWNNLTEVPKYKNKLSNKYYDSDEPKSTFKSLNSLDTFLLIIALLVFASVSIFMYKTSSLVTNLPFGL